MLKRIINNALGALGVRLVNKAWGPCGYLASLRKLTTCGWSPRQIVDVGAWKGTWTEECMTLFPTAKYLLIDPLPSNRTALEALVGRCPNVTAWHGAVGATCGEVTIHLHDDQSSVLAATVPEWRGSETRTVPMRTLDSFLASGAIEPPQLLKADVQGFELEVLRGATDVLRSLDAALIEVSFDVLYEGQPLAHDIVRYMADAGFRIFDFCSYAQAADRHLLQSDILFVRGDWPATSRGHHE